MKKRLQNKIAESRHAFLVTSLICGILWIMACLRDDAVWPVFGCVITATFLMAELNNSNALIRIYSRMVSCAFLVFMTMAPFEYLSLREAIVILCCVGFYLAMFRCYQNDSATGWTFYAFLCLGLASVIYIQVLFFLPLLWFFMASNLLSMSAKTFFASLLGILTPYWFLAAYHSVTDDFNTFVDGITAIADFGPIADYSSLGFPQILTASLIIVCALIGSVHFINTSSNDKIRTRKLYEIFMTTNIVAIVFLALQPQHFDMLLGIITVNTAPLIAHYISLTHTRLTNIVTVSLIVLSILITVYNTWMPSLISL